LRNFRELRDPKLQRVQIISEYDTMSDTYWRRRADLRSTRRGLALSPHLLDITSRRAGDLIALRDRCAAGAAARERRVLEHGACGGERWHSLLITDRVTVRVRFT